MKKILIFSLAYYPNYIGGAEVAIKEISERILPDEIKFHMVTLRFSKTELKEEQIGNVLVHRVGLGSLYFSKIIFIPLATLTAFFLHKKYKFDAFWAMMSYMLFPIVFLRIAGLKIPYVLSLQEGDTFEQVYLRPYIRVLLPFLRTGFKNATVVQVISSFLGGWALRLGFKGPIEVVYNGANARDFLEVFKEEELEEFKKNVGKKEGDIYLVTTSRLVNKNATDDVIRAMPLLPANIYFLVVGGGEDEEMLKKLAENLGVSSRVKFIGQVDRTLTPKYRKISDIFVRPSRSEGMGNSFVSAMAARLPIIATQEGGIAEFMFDEKRNPDKETTGWVVDKNSPEQIAEAVKDILNSPEKVKKVTATARELAFQKYNWDSIAKDMKQKVFNQVFKI